MRPDDTVAGPSAIASPVKVHLLDGSTVVFSNGATVSRDSIVGRAMSYALLRDVGIPRPSVPMDSVLGVEAFEKKVLGGQSFIWTVAATAVSAVGLAALALAVFGSCPTVYSDSGAAAILQAEGFSYSIAPIMEHRDVDPLRVRAGADGVLRLELRNEALETHYINHIEVLAVRHEEGERVVPDQVGRPVVLAGFTPVARAVDRAGRDVRAVLVEHDGELYSSAPLVISGAKPGDLDDWIDIDVSTLPPGDSVAVLLRLRNSLLNTVLLYEGMLGGRDALDWLNTGLQNIATTVELAQWYTATMGLRASIDARSPITAHMGDVGPIAFRDVAIVLPRATVDTMRQRIRLRFVADNWRIDEVRVAGRITRPEHAVLPIDSVIVPTPVGGGPPVADHSAVAVLADADDRYLETRPGQRLTLVFKADTVAVRSPTTRTTYLIAWQGWYREWIRASWLAEPTRLTPFVPGDAAMLEALGRWTQKKASFERDFYASRIPVK